MASETIESSDGSQTVEEFLGVLPEILNRLAQDTAPLMISNRWNGAFSSEKSLTGAMLLYWQGQAMVALSQLRYWLVQNDYARSLTMKQVCGGYGLISVEMTKLLDFLALVRIYAGMAKPFLPPGTLDYMDDDDDDGIEQARR